MPTPARTVTSFPGRGRAALGGVAVASVVSLIAAMPSQAATGSTAKRAAVASSAAKPGVSGKIITLASHASFDGDAHRAWDIGADNSGTAYVAWLAASKDSTTDRHLFFCTLPLGATACHGGIQDVTVPDPSAVNGIRVLVSPAGLVSVLWYAYDSPSNTGVYESTSNKGAALTTPTLVVPDTSAGSLLDAEIGPTGSIWTVIQTAVDGNMLHVRSSFTASPATLKGPSKVKGGTNFIGFGYTALAFWKKTPVIASTNVAQNDPIIYSYKPGGSWKSWHSVKGTESAYGGNPGLTATGGGLILSAISKPNFYHPVTAKWNGHGFGKPISTGDHHDVGSFDTSSDASGRMVSATDELGEITVANFADDRHAASIRFGAPKTATPAGGDPQVISTPRGHAWVAWAIESSSAGGDGDTLKIAPVLLAGLDKHSAKHGAHGSVTITGPVSCQPASSIKVGVKGSATHGWKVTGTSLKLGKRKLGKSLNGAKLKPGKKYVLKGSATFSDGHGHSTAKAKLKFKACPKP